MRELLLVDGWTQDEMDMLFDIALNNHPVRYLLNDLDVKAFYRKIIGMLDNENPKALQVENYFDKE